MPLRILQELPYLDICHDSRNGWLYAEWRGSISLAQATEGGLAVLHLVEAERCRKLLNDNSLVTDMHVEAPQWQSVALFPQLHQVGLQYVAWVYSSNLYSRFSADQCMQSVEQPLIMPFEDLTVAKNWLRTLE